jgi:enoyl-CoA hydratase
MSLVTTEITGGAAWITLNDPERRNALNVEMVDQINDAFDLVETDAGVHAVALTGAGSAFCAGADLALLKGRDIAVFRRVYDAFLRVRRCSLPTIAAVNGVAVGAGLNMALACDLRVTTPKAKFISRFLDIGLHPGGGHAWMLNRIAGIEATKAFVLFGQTFDGESAVAAGLALRCVAPEQLLSEVNRLASGAAKFPRELLIRAKQTIERTIGLPDHDKAIELEGEAQAWSATLPFLDERIEALQRESAARSRR